MANGTQTSTTAPLPYIQELLTREGSGLFPQLSESLDAPFQQYGGPRVAGFSADQLAAMEQARQSVGATDPQEAQAGDLMARSQQALTGGGQQAQQLLDQSVGTGADWLSRALGQTQQMAQQGNPLYDQALGLSNQSVGAGTNWLNQALGQSQQLAQEGNPLYDQAQDSIDQSLAAGAPGLSSVLAQAQQMAQQGNPLFGQAQDLMAQSAQGPTAAGLQQYMDPYQQSVIDTTMSELNRQSDIAGQGLAAQAVGAGAFGGGRQGVMEAEAGRNLADVQARTLAQLNSQNFGQALNTFQNQQRMQGQAGQALGGLGQQQFGAQQGALGQAAGAAQGLAGLYGNAASQQAGLGGQQAGIQQNALSQLMSGGQGLSTIYGSAAGQQAGLGAQQFGAQQGALGQMMSGGRGLSDIYGGAAGQQAGLAGQQAGGLGDLARQQLGLGSFMREQDLADINNLMTMGGLQQQQQQAGLDVGYQDFLQQRQYEDPRSRVAFMSDIIRGAPSGQQTMSQTYTPPPSPLQTIAGLGSLAAGFA